MIRRKRRRIRRLLGLFGLILGGGAGLLVWQGWYAPRWADLPLAGIIGLAVYNLSLILAQRPAGTRTRVPERRPPSDEHPSL
ncbi:MAG TPA: hypothetical protein VD886_20535 [Herpetosiphonaceae bacterium]|nr:hypothetical protein [Herpetosiphonaceae bacterium]